MTFRTIPQSILLLEQQSIDDRILGILEQGVQSLDYLDKSLPDVGSTRLLFAIDRLSRTGKSRSDLPVMENILCRQRP
jgi:outer membrane receptor for ferric coprogen and ferric-rhodotorulic acid